MDTAAGISFRVEPNSSGTSVPSPSVNMGAYNLRWPQGNVHPHKIHQTPVFQTLQARKRKEALALDAIHSDEPFVYLSPIIQAGQFGVHEESESLHLLINHLSTAHVTPPTINFTSGYFGFNAGYQKLVLDNNFAKWRILAASPKVLPITMPSLRSALNIFSQANGFYGSKGISGRIPEGYTYLEQNFMKAVSASGLDSGDNPAIELKEWERPGWTYHAKGAS